MDPEASRVRSRVWSSICRYRAGVPACLLRRSYRDGGRRDEAFTRDLVWQRSSLLISAERADLENEFIEITAEEACSVTVHREELVILVLAHDTRVQRR